MLAIAPNIASILSQFGVEPPAHAALVAALVPLLNQVSEAGSTRLGAATKRARPKQSALQKRQERAEWADLQRVERQALRHTISDLLVCFPTSSYTKACWFQEPPKSG